MKTVWAGCLLFLISHAALAFSEPPPNVFNDNARASVLSIKTPSKWIGKLISPSGSWCSAGLIQRDLILTAAHCVTDETKHVIINGDYRFHYGMIAGRSLDSSGIRMIWAGTTDPQHNRISDWAILRLSLPLGEKYGWMGVRSEDLNLINNQNVIGITAYSGDYMNGKTASIEMGCAFTGMVSNGTFMHDCDTSRGASGAPMYRAEKDAAGNVGYYIVAINVADMRDGQSQSLLNIPFIPGHANIAVPASQFLPQLREIMGNP